MKFASSDASRHAAERLGRKAEYIVAQWYCERGFRILARRLRTEAGELDLVVADATTVIFVEVKARARLAAAAEAVTPRQQRRIAAAAAIALAASPEWERGGTRFDVMLVVGGTVHAIPDAFLPDAG